MMSELIEEEITKLMAINENHSETVMLLRSLNKTLLAGVESSTIIEMLYLLEQLKLGN